MRRSDAERSQGRARVRARRAPCARRARPAACGRRVRRVRPAHRARRARRARRSRARRARGPAAAPPAASVTLGSLTTTKRFAMHVAQITCPL